MCQKRLDLSRPHIPEMALVVKQDEAPAPLQILCFGADAVMLQADLAAHLVQQLGRIRRFGIHELGSTIFC